MASSRQPGSVCIATKPWFDVVDGTIHVGKSPLPGPVSDFLGNVSGLLGYRMVERIDLNRCAFFEQYEQQKPPFGLLSTDARASLNSLLDRITADEKLKDIGWIAYMLATTIHECRSAANKWLCTWVPVSESGGKSASYGAEQTVVDWDGWPLGPDGRRVPAASISTPTHKPKPAADAPHAKARFYGRGFVQITHQENYRAMDNALGLGGMLVVNPDAALQPEIAYKIMSYGMRRGSFRGSRQRTLSEGYFGGHKLADYIAGPKKDFLNARDIINGKLDHAKTIKGYAETFEKILYASQEANSRHFEPIRP